MRFLIRFAPVALLLCAHVSADPLAQQWIDRVTHEVQKQEGPLSTKPFEYQLSGGAFGYFTDNIFLEPNRTAEQDVAAIGFVNGRVDYTDTRLELSVDILASYDFYDRHYKARSDQEHGYGKIRFADGVIDAQLVLIARHEVDGLNGVFADRAAKVVTDILPRLGVKLGKFLTVEGFAQIEIVHFIGSTFDSRENENYRGGLGARADITDTIAVGLEAGYNRISYRQTDITPNSDGYFAHAVIRGEVTSRLLLEAGVGYSTIHSFHSEPGTSQRADAQGLDADFHARYELTETLLVLVDYTRQFGFAGSGSSFQSLDRGIAIVEWQALEKLKLRLRGQYDRVNPSNGPIRSFASGDFSATYEIMEHLAAEGGFSARWANTKSVSSDNYDNWVVYFGFVVAL